MQLNEPPQPLSASAERIDSLDFIRGFAVLGIVVANILAMGQPSLAAFWPAAFQTPPTPADSWLWLGQFVLVDGKMRGLFTLLFGAGMALFVDRAMARDGNGIGLQARRLGWLFLFGLLHFVLLWDGDILMSYAFAGMIALLFVAWEPHKQLVLGLVMYVAGIAMGLLTYVPMQLAAETALGERPAFTAIATELSAAASAEIDRAAAGTIRLREGSYLDWVGGTLTDDLPHALWQLGTVWEETLPLILLGMALYRYGLFVHPPGAEGRKRLAWAVSAIALGSLLSLVIGLRIKAQGVTYYGVFAALYGWAPLPRLSVIVGLAVVLAALACPAVGWWGTRLKAAGRVAFSNYIGTSALALVLFHPWGGNLYGKLDRVELYLLVPAFWLIMLLWSKPWLDRFRYGPLEWLWRCLTYWTLFPLRR